MELDERKQKILNAIIQNYQATGEPVGSRTISKLTELKISAATIRNEMADLEEMGLITQPHTSAGRIPTDKGYRLYVDQMMKEREAPQLPADTRSVDLLFQRVDRVEELLKQMAKILAANTNYATMITGPRNSKNKVKFIQLSRMEEGRLLAVVVLGGNIVRNNILHVDEYLSDEDILQLNLLLNNHLSGLSIEEINLSIISRIKEEAGPHREIVDKVLDAVAETITQEDKISIYTSGTPNIFKYPELSDNDRASELISTLEEKEGLGTIITAPATSYGDKHEIQVFIGDEVPVESMKDCSVVTAKYELGNGVQGKIGIIGPKRMDYEKVVNTLQDTMAQLDVIFRKPEQDD